MPRENAEHPGDCVIICSKDVLLNLPLYCPGKTDLMKSKGILCFSLALFVLFPGSLLSQDHESFGNQLLNIRENSLFKIGPFYIQPRLQFRDIGYDDNVYFRRIEDDPVADYTAAFSPEVKISFLVGHTLILHFAENPEYYHYVNEKERRSLTNSYSTGFNLFLLRRFSLSGNYSHSRRWARVTSEFFAPSFITKEGVNGSFFYESSSRITIGLSGRSEQVSYEDLLYEKELNRQEKEGSVEFYYRVFSESRFFLSVAYGDFQFEDVGSQWRNANSFQILSGIKFPLLGRIRGTFALGYKHFNLLTEEEDAHSGLVSQTNLSYRIGRFAFNLDYSRGIDFSFYQSNALFISDELRSGMAFYLSRSLRLGYDFRYGENNYPKSDMFFLPDGSIEEIKRRDIFRTHSVALVFRVGQSTGLGVSFNYAIHSSNHLYYGDRQRMFIGGYLTYDF